MLPHKRGAERMGIMMSSFLFMDEAELVAAEAYADAFADGWPRAVAERRAERARAAFVAAREGERA